MNEKPTKESAETGQETDLEKLEQEVDHMMSPTRDDPVLDKAIDEIVRDESDEVIASEDKARAEAATPDKSESKIANLKAKCKQLAHTWWSNKRWRYGSLIGLLGVVILLLIVPFTRYGLLNAAGVRASASMRIIDGETKQPLKNATVTLGGASAVSDVNGNVSLTNVRLGASQIVITKRAFAESRIGHTVGWGSNPLGNYPLKATGIKFSFQLNDYFDDGAVAKAEVAIGSASALSDEKGLAVVVVAPGDEAESVTITKSGYRSEQPELPESDETIEVKMVLGRKHAFISKRSGVFDLYSIDLDGKNETKILAGTGNERNDIGLLQHPANNTVGLVSTRGEKRNRDGFLLSTLSVVRLDQEDSTAVTVDTSEQIRLLGWIDDNLVYVRVKSGTSGRNPERNQLVVYNVGSDNKKVLAAANYFNTVIVVDDRILYAPSSLYSDQVPGLYSITTDGTDKKTLFTSEAWNVFRTDVDEVVISSSERKWYRYNLSTDVQDELDGRPSDLQSINFISLDGADGALWSETRDGKGVLLRRDKDGQDEIVRSQAGLRYPVEWIAPKVVLYQVNTAGESADYIYVLGEDEATKLVDVTPANSIDDWYYY